MLFSGFPFLLGFLPLALFGFALAGKAGNVWLLAVSLLFYAAGAAAFLPLLVASVIGNYGLLRLMHGSPRSGHRAAFGVAANLAVLGWFKYLSPDAATPLGLSFFTFTQIGCLLHHASGDTPPPRPLEYALFAAFFPGLTAGPILNAAEMLPEFARRRELSAGNLVTGLGFFAIGLLKKTMLADGLGGVVADGFAAPDGLTIGPAWQTACAYSLQLYFDFSGYSDMAIGLARMVGLHYPDNFDRPYRAPSVIAYWQSWHMSLTRFLMANVHAPLTMAVFRWRRARGLSVTRNAQKSPSGFACMIGLPILATMMLVSLWHGAAWTFVVFGLLHTVFLLVNHLWRLHALPAFPRVASVAVTYLCVLIASVFFRADTLATAGSLLTGMAGAHGFGPPDIRTVICLAVLYVIVWFAPSTRQIMRGLSWSPGRAIAMGCAATIGMLSAGGTGEFLYFRF